jgi:hypothetical protein
MRWEILKTTPIVIHEVTPDAGARPPTLNPVEERHTDFSTQFASSLNYSFSDQFEVGIVGIGLLGIQARGLIWKTELGEDRGAHLIGVNGSFLSDQVSKGEARADQGLAANPWRAKASTSSKNFGISYGYQVSNEHLFYVGAAYNHFENQNSIQHSLGSNGTSPAAEYKVDSEGYSRSLSTGVLFGKVTQVKLGGTISQIAWENLKKTENRLDFSVSTTFEDFFLGPPKVYDLKPKNPWSGSDFGGLALSYLIGFGTGQAAQGNWSEKGYIFAAADATAMLSFYTDLDNTNSSTSASAALAILVVSRIWQIVDLVIEASSSQKKVPGPVSVSGASGNRTWHLLR